MAYIEKSRSFGLNLPRPYNYMSTESMQAVGGNMIAGNSSFKILPLDAVQHYQAGGLHTAAGLVSTLMLPILGNVDKCETKQ